MKTYPEVEVMEFGPGKETRSGTKWTRIHLSWVLWVSTEPPPSEPSIACETSLAAEGKPHLFPFLNIAVEI
ncbi:hypothetical protein SDJN02_27347 [Cucurbita argyrosperma subsp. argyrosperma]|nr:hypothetical protein SDJN02_27347 [Cucurbita argyrosperma subsp. argyrosperma]